MSTQKIQNLEALYTAFDGLSVEGGWHRRSPALWPEPRMTLVPHCWHWRDMKPVLDAAGRLVSTEFAERRNLTMRNPAPGNVYSTVRTIVAAYQMMLPGERARSHRHTPNALRLVLEGRGTYTIVDGDSLDMVPGDVLLTPNWCWHEHGTTGSESCYWLDYLDVPLVHLLEPMFFEPHPGEFEEEVNIRRPQESPMVFRWADTLRRLKGAGPDADGTCERQVELGSPALRSIALFMQELAGGRATAMHRTTANSVFTVVRGKGSSVVGGTKLEWEYGDTFAVPAWQPVVHHASEDTILFRVTDEPLMRALEFLWTADADGRRSWHR
jgi:gentisate 1,2-dioxygenase